MYSDFAMFPNLVCKLCIINNVPFDARVTRVNVVVLVEKVGKAINKRCMNNYVYNLLIYNSMQRMSYYIHMSVC